MSTVKFEQVIEEELDRIKTIRANKKAHDPNSVDEEGRLIGLALSGGGIRSAAFNLGILQALANKGALEKIDYLSTVSGGGYIGSALTWFLSKDYAHNSSGDGTEREFGTGPDDHPLGRRDTGAKLVGQRDNERIDHIRSLGNYLRPTRDLGTGSAVALVVRNVVLAVLLWFLPLVFLMALASTIGEILFDFGLPRIINIHTYGNIDWIYWLTPIFAVIALLPFGRLGPEITERVEPNKRQTRYFEQLGRQRHVGLYLSLALITVVIASLPIFLNMIDAKGGLGPFIGAAFSSGGLFATVYGILGGAGRPQTKDLALKIGVVVLGVSLLLSAYWAAIKLTQLFSAYVGDGMGGYLALLALLVLAAGTVIAGASVALNHLSLHRFYRDRLMEAFLPDPPKDGEASPPDQAKEGNENGAKWRPALRANKAPLAGMCDAQSRGPYHLINANAILVGSEYTTVRNRGGDNFLLSPLYVGSDRTNWVSTHAVYGAKNPDSEPNQPDKEPQGLQLSTAMAISGAAANPNSGPGGKGLTRSAIVSRLMMLLNIRLAYWIPNPRNLQRSNHWLVKLTDWINPRNPGVKSKRAVFTYPGVAALLGFTHREDSGYLELSDGGHFENLGIYELIRRRLPLIIVSDSGQDGAFGFSDLSNAIRRVQVDFGVTIRFQSSPCGLDGIRPDPNRKMLLGDGTIASAERGWAIAEIDYPESAPPFTDDKFAGLLTPKDRKGCLIYLKPTMRPGLPSSVVGYRAEKPEFPHQTTADQFFDEAQFEAYRELGYATCKDMLVEYEGIRDGRPEAPKGYDDEPLRLIA